MGRTRVNGERRGEEEKGKECSREMGYRVCEVRRWGHVSSVLKHVN